ncbi:MAG: hypothetical protein A3H57_05170 [Candidatus Taylorbacteria bacterium RIFCSPLOWO2_02_FULL_43_11]|uniref:AB hydrolase-1 domain-containing protein n=1 Tax=Candidatus Taylorbacteria bacterium RIFCSPHIGHO2_02_FULL_43_32b TaxID=1802306 RepID=A0A1G2MIU1_9BACT|nr:MAG: hypothetical protein A2743_02380 [Candidatus Taylorbacteria bacterium RIFCSPHIGHO2_01_FULL_43_47]OHA23796.1 MAG: hypothetical protein A3C72_03655 [Candidatus Taylorbacteria bacterium RIFCSPHIGHO2_02_FULL_43_32b]OHA37144.1 MAG: hypothetical protein A3H57_05170 [Candidatus Taylorbacteria bacterium RIFCSPLOWO2_02_FULL_43_11]
MVTESFLANGLYYRTNGIDKEKLTLIFIHGLSGSSSAWEKYEQAFKVKCNTVCFDLRGHGKSKKWPDYRDYELEDQADDILLLSKTLGLKNFVVVAHSFGVLIALHLLRHHKEMISSAIFLTPVFTVKNVKWAKIAILPLIFYSKITSALPFKNKTGIQLDYSKFKHYGFWHFKRMASDIWNTTPRIYLYCLRQMYNFSGESVLKDIKTPILIIHGTKDTVVSLIYSKEAQKKLPNSTLIKLKNANHLLILNNLRQVISSIESFLNLNLKK